MITTTDFGMVELGLRAWHDQHLNDIYSVVDLVGPCVQRMSQRIWLKKKRRKKHKKLSSMQDLFY